MMHSIDVSAPPGQMPEAPEHCRNVLVAAGAEPLCAPTLLRAQTMADLLGGSLHVLRVAQLSSSWPSLLSVRPGGPYSARRLVELKSETLQVCTKVLGPNVPAVLVRSGSFAPIVTRAAERLFANVVVVPGRRAHTGKTVTQIARESGRPVLVAEAPRHSDAIVAATDLMDARTPVVAQGARLAARLRAPLTAVHNHPPLVHALFGLTSATPGVPPSGSVLERARARMDALSGRFDQDIVSVVVSRTTTATAILETAREAHADLVIVGTRPRSTCARWMRPSVSARIVDQAERSVMVVPMNAGPQDAWSTN